MVSRALGAHAHVKSFDDRVGASWGSGSLTVTAPVEVARNMWRRYPQGCVSKKQRLSCLRSDRAQEPPTPKAHDLDTSDSQTAATHKGVARKPRHQGQSWHELPDVARLWSRRVGSGGVVENSVRSIGEENNLKLVSRFTVYFVKDISYGCSYRSLFNIDKKSNNWRLQDLQKKKKQTN